MKHKNYRVLVLNTDYVPLTIISWKRAIVLEMADRVVMLDFYKSDSIKDGHGRCYPIPAVVVLKKYVKRKYQYAPFSRKNVFIRDQMRCQYCAQRFEVSKLTFDHVVPKSKWPKTRGVTSTCWENIVTSCLRCNGIKADRSCDESRMFPLTQPYRPSYGEMFVGLSPHRDRMPAEWTPYLEHLPFFKAVNHHEEETTSV